MVYNIHESYKKWYLSARGNGEVKKRYTVLLLKLRNGGDGMSFKELKEEIPALTHNHIKQLLVDEKIVKDGWNYKLKSHMLHDTTKK